MRVLLKGGTVFRQGRFARADILVEGERIAKVSPVFPSDGVDFLIDCSTKAIVPGFVDVHVHLREPGFLWKETIRTGTMAAARGGYTAVCAMPNLNPVPDSVEHLAQQLDAIRRDAVVNVYPFGAITRDEKGETLADMEALAPYVAGFSDDGRGVQDGATMRAAMVRAKAVGRRIAAHCEVNALLEGGYVHAGAYAKANGHAGISGESEWRQIERDIALVCETGCPYHALHISTKESVALIRAAKAEGLPVTCETAPHYLCLCDEDMREDGRFKMNPPIRAREDMLALID